MSKTFIDMSRFEEYLSTRNSTLWGRYFDIKNEDGKERAAVWMQDEIESYRNWLHRQKKGK